MTARPARPARMRVTHPFWTAQVELERQARCVELHADWLRKTIDELRRRLPKVPERVDLVDAMELALTVVLWAKRELVFCADPEAWLQREQAGPPLSWAEMLLVLAAEVERLQTVATGRAEPHQVGAGAGSTSSTRWAPAKRKTRKKPAG
jgi:hypothetical protein